MFKLSSKSWRSLSHLRNSISTHSIHHARLKEQKGLFFLSSKSCFNVAIYRVSRRYASAATSPSTNAGSLPKNLDTNTKTNIETKNSVNVLLASAHVASKNINYMQRQFQVEDLKVFDDKMENLKNSVENYFAETYTIQLLFKGGALVKQDVSDIVSAQGLTSFEHQLSYATGKFNATLDSLYILLDSLVISNNEKFGALKDKVALKKPGQPGTLQLEQYTLRDEIKVFDLSKHLTQLQKGVDNNNLFQASFQITAIALCAISLHLGVPFVISLPATLACSIGGFVWTRMRWNHLRQSFLAGFGREHKLIRSALEEKYKREMNRIMVQPIQDILNEFQILESTKKSS